MTLEKLKQGGNMRYLIFITAFFLISCGSRKREVERSSEKAKEAIEIQIDSTAQKDVTKVEEVKTILVTNEVKKDLSFKGVVSDTAKAASVESEVVGSKTKYVFKGFKTVDFKAEKSDTKKDSIAEVVSSEVDLSEITTTKETNQKTSSKNETESISVDRDYSISWWWLLLLITVIYLGRRVYRLYLKKRLSLLSLLFLKQRVD